VIERQAIPTERISDSTGGAQEVEIVSQSTQDKRLPVIAHRDLNILFSLLGLAPVALIVSERRWPSLCSALARFTLLGRVGRRRRKSIQGRLRTAFPHNNASFDALCREFEAHQLELRLQILRNVFQHSWQPQINIQGVSHLEAALAAGRGAILWISRFAFTDTIWKFGLHNAGYPTVHLAKSMHGFSPTKFGQRWLNPIYLGFENRFLGERVVIHEHTSTVALRRLCTVLANNGVVSITVYSWGAQAVEAPFLGSRIRIGTGAPGLAWKTGAPLLPVFAIRNAETGRFDLLIDEPLQINQTAPKSEAEKSIVTQYLTRLEPHVVANPGQWLEWPSLRKCRQASWLLFQPLAPLTSGIGGWLLS
jgi:lauroyl/myristoyl acyltransferase